MAVRYEDLEVGTYPRAHRFETAAFRARARARARADRLRVTRRRLTVVVVVPVIVVMVLMGGGTSIASKPGAPRAVVLQQGDTLWGIAERFAPAGVDLRAYVDALYELNDISGAPAAGQKIALPGPRRG